MKKNLKIAFVLLCSIQLLNAQEESTASFDAGTDLVSNYIWRGTKFGTGPALQPFVEFNTGIFTIGSWGSYAFTDSDFSEADLYMSFNTDFGLSIGLTDYYFPGTPYFNYASESGSHGFEVNLGYEISRLSIGANYMINEASWAGTSGGDIYFELGYNFEAVSLFVGAGDGWHTTDGNFAVCNLGLSYTKEIEITEKFALPLTGSMILNPQTEQYYIVVALSL